MGIDQRQYQRVVIMTQRFERHTKRIVTASWERDLRRQKFIESFLARRGVSITQNSCPIVLLNGVRCILKEFRRIGSGGVGLIWGCDHCSGGVSAFANLNAEQLKTRNLPPFSGACKNSLVTGDVNKLIVLPSCQIRPSQVLTRVYHLESKKVIERRSFQIV